MKISRSRAKGKVATGEYTGDGNDNRQITCGFVPYLVTIQRISALNPYTWFIMGPTGRLCMGMHSGGYPASHDKPYLHASDGFTLGGDGGTANDSAESYKWVALN